MKCLYCKGLCVKRGKKNGVERYSCKICGKTQQKVYKRQRISKEKQELIVKLSNESCGIRSISRILDISKSSVQRLIIRISSELKVPIIKNEIKSTKWTNCVLFADVKPKNAGLFTLSIRLAKVYFFYMKWKKKVTK